MRLWTLHPRYLDAMGLVALWREALLAKAVLRGRTSGYRRHPQLERFRETKDPVAALNAYLTVVHSEASRRGYQFDERKLNGVQSSIPLVCSRGQIAFEWAHLVEKLRRRSPARYRLVRALSRPRAHPLFRVRPGPVASWERGVSTGSSRLVALDE
jgi:hypothetical protein